MQLIGQSTAQARFATRDNVSVGAYESVQTIERERNAIACDCIFCGEERIRDFFLCSPLEMKDIFTPD